MRLFDFLFNERCPRCGTILSSERSKLLLGHVVKQCPKCDYCKEFHPALEGYIESGVNPKTNYTMRSMTSSMPK